MRTEVQVIDPGDRLGQAIAAIDAANARDPNLVLVRGVEEPKEVAHARLVTEWVLRLRPQPGEALLLAARAHHIRRWEVPRSSFPPGRPGYLRWRRELHARHAAHVARILEPLGYEQETIERVQDLVRKRGLGGETRDPEVQALEDALCLTFLETQFADLATQLGDDRMVEVVAKTLTKMSEEGQRLALDMPMTSAERDLLGRALGA